MDCEFGLCYILLDLDWKPFRLRFIIILTRYFTGAGLGNTWTTNFDYNYYISRDLDFKVYTWIKVWILIVICLTDGLGLENTWTVNLDYNY